MQAHRSKAVERTPVRVPLIREEIGLIRSWQLMRENVLSIIPEAATREKIISGRTGKRWHMIMDPGAIRHVLLDRLEDYPKSDVTKNLLRPAIGESLFIAEGAHWRWQRRTAAPAFSHRNVMNLAPIMTAAAERSAGRIAQAGRRAVNLLDEMVATTFDVISEVTFSGDGSFERADGASRRSRNTSRRRARSRFWTCWARPTGCRVRDGSPPRRAWAR